MEAQDSAGRPPVTQTLGTTPDAVAPDGSDVFLLPALPGGGTAVFRLGPGAVAKAVRHPRVEEIWFVLSGQGRIWRHPDTGPDGDETPLSPGVALTIPRATRFQFRCDGTEPLLVLGVTMPPWSGEADAVLVEPHWPPTV
jgi:mannose-6-phosphate isomerase-like protein (cupin superfamily)